MSDNIIHVSEPVLNIYKLFQTVNNDYDTYDSCIVAAVSEEDAKTIAPNDDEFPNAESEKWYSGWGKTLDDIQAELIGTAVPGTKRGVILASFNAG